MKTTYFPTFINYRQRMSAQQRGAALVMSLVILLILTILGVAAMRGSAMQQLMAGNAQETNRAFEFAESGLTRALTDTTNFADMNNSVDANYTVGSLTVDVKTTFKQTSPPPRSSNPTGHMAAQNAHFDQQSTATTLTGARSVIHQGVKTNIPAANF